MIDKRAMEAALQSHALWKMRLYTAINLGKLDLPLDKIGRDDFCEFGQWLDGPTWTEQEKQDPHYLEVRRLHAEFHRRAAQVAELAVSGRSNEAKKQIAEGGEYHEASAQLQSATKAWKTAIGDSGA